MGVMNINSKLLNISEFYLISRCGGDQMKLEQKIEKEKNWIDTPKAHKLVNGGLLASFGVHMAAKLLNGYKPIKKGSGKVMWGLSAVHIYQKRKAIIGYFKGLKKDYDQKKTEHLCDCDNTCGDDCKCGYN